jgi:hypothetical protein
MDIIDRRKLLEEKPQKEYTGSPYLNEEFVKGELYYNHQYVYQDIMLRYNIYDDVLEYLNKRNGVAYDIDPTDKVDKAIIGTDTFVVDSIPRGNKLRKCYFKLLCSGEVRILVKMRVDFIIRRAEQLYTAATPAKFARNVDTYYVRIDDQPPQKIKNIKSLITVINDRKKALSSFAKNEKLRNKPKDMVKLAGYYESLQASGTSGYTISGD